MIDASNILDAKRRKKDEKHEVRKTKKWFRKQIIKQYEVQIKYKCKWENTKKIK